MARLDIHGRAAGSRSHPPWSKFSDMQKIAGTRFGVLIAVVSLIAILIVSPSIAAARPSSGSSGCVQSAPRAAIDNNWAWGSSGSWGMPGQQLRYAIDVFNNDVGCGSTTFVVTLSAPSGFSVSAPTNMISLASASTGYVFMDVSSPTTIADGDYSLTVSVGRGGTGASVQSGSSFYKVYSSDAVAPQLYWIYPGDGTAITGRSTYVSIAANDDHAVRRVDLSIDGVPTATTGTCDNTSYECGLSYKWSIRRVHGTHTATFTATDWMGNVATQSATFTVN
jgi:hypothetical protein